MNMNKTFLAATLSLLLLSLQAGATRFKSIQVVDNETLMLCFQDGDIRYRDDATGPSAYLKCPYERHYPELYRNMVMSVFAQAYAKNVDHRLTRPSRRSADDPRWQTSENLHLVMLAHSLTQDAVLRQELEQAMYDEAGWGLGRNPANIVEMTGLGSRHITDCYTTGRNDGAPGTHPGQTPFNGTETWSPGHNGGDARVILAHCYPDWDTGGWPRQESFFNQRYFWVNGEFTPRETMRGKMAVLGYLYGIRP